MPVSGGGPQNDLPLTMSLHVCVYALVYLCTSVQNLGLGWKIMFVVILMANVLYLAV